MAPDLRFYFQKIEAELQRKNMSEKRAASSPRTNQRKKPRKSVLKSEVNGPVRRSERRKSRVSFAPKNEVKGEFFLLCFFLFKIDSMKIELF